MKKYLIIAAAAALALASCAKVESYTVNDEETPIGFTNYSPRSITKADGTLVIDNKLANGKKFGVYSYATENGTAFATTTAAALGTTFMDGVSVTYATGGDTDATKNTYSPLRYWPSGKTPDWLTFWAYYPVEETSGKVTAGSNGITYTKPSGTNGLGSFAFTAQSTAAEMVDFCVADVVNDKIYGTTSGEHIAVSGVVPFTFRHQLTKVQIKFKRALDVDSDSDGNLDACDANTKVYLTDAKVVDVLTTGTLSASYDPTAVLPALSTATSWDGQGTPATYEVFVNGKDVTDAVANKVELTKDPTAVADGEIFLMVPQTMLENNVANAQKITVKWDVVTDGVTTSNEADLFLNDCKSTDGGNVDANIDWVKNHSVIYTITIGPQPIRFTATVASWEDDQAGFFNVN